MPEVKKTRKVPAAAAPAETKKPAEKSAIAVEGYSASDLALELEIDPSELRQHLRALEVEKPGSRWVWPKKTDPSLVEIRNRVKARIKELAAKPPKEKPVKAEKSDAPAATKKLPTKTGK